MYTTLYIDGFSNDEKAFIFTLKNPHGIEPTRFKKKKTSKHAFFNDEHFGPIFGEKEIVISDECNKENSCEININEDSAYECHPEYKSSLFVNTNGPNEPNKFTVYDMEIYIVNKDIRWLYGGIILVSIPLSIPLPIPLFPCLPLAIIGYFGTLIVHKQYELLLCMGDYKREVVDDIVIFYKKEQ